MTETFPLHIKAYEYAKHCLGVHEVPDGSNHGPIQVYTPSGGVDFFEEHDFVAGTGYPWCAAFWLTCWSVGANHPFPYLSPGAYSLGDWAKAHGMAKPITELKPGDGCVWNEGSGHISMFESYDPVNKLVHTIDGNWGNKVVRTTHNVAALRVGIHVPEKTLIPVVKQPYYVITTSVNGHKRIVFSKFATRKKILGILPRILAKYDINGITIKRSMRKPI